MTPQKSAYTSIILRTMPEFAITVSFFTSLYCFSLKCFICGYIGKEFGTLFTMEQKGKEISVEVRKLILKYRLEGKSYREIGQLVGRTHSSCQRVYDNYVNSGSILSKPRCGRPPLLTEREKKRIVQLVPLNPRITAHQGRLEVEERFSKSVSEESVRRTWRNAGYHGRVARRKPHISEINRKKRMDFANEHVSKPLSFWKKVIFSDESKFCIFGIKGKKLVWRKSGTAMDKENLLPTVKHGGGGIMVWGCMAANGVGNLTFIESTMDHKDYINILNENLLQSAQKLQLQDDFCFQQDNDPKHTAHNVKLWLLYNVKNQLRSPPQSPDLNPIEHLWDLLERRIRQHNISSKNMLKEVIMAEWSKITAEDTKNLVDSMPRRLAEVLKRNGNPTKY